MAWPHRTLEQHIAQIDKRTPRTLLNDRTCKRHQKAIDPETGQLLGYARWHLPPSHATNADGASVWSEAVVPAVRPEEEDEIRQIADTVIWDPKYESEEFIAPLRVIKDEILARKPYIRT